MAPTPTSPSAEASAVKDVPPRSLPSQLGRYTLFDFVGRGGMADIYLARSRTELGVARLCVVKEVRPELAADEHFSKLLAEEAKLAARLSHPNIVAVEELAREQGRLFLAMEYVEGLDLRELLRLCSRRKIGLPIAYALQIVTEVLRGLDHAHKLCDEEGEPLGIVHRDVSPSNVLLSFDGEVKLCDFGIASAAQGEQLPSPTIEGKAGYMSPEQARGDRIDARSDVFAASVLLWEMLAGRRMYRPDGGERVIDLARKADVHELPPRGLPAERRLHAIVAKGLAADRDERYGSAGELLAAIDQWSADVRAQLSPMRFGRWLSEHFAEEKLARRRARERVVAALERGPAVVLTPRPAEVAPREPADPAAQPSGQEREADEPTNEGARAELGDSSSVGRPGRPESQPETNARVAFVSALVAFVAASILLWGAVLLSGCNRSAAPADGTGPPAAAATSASALEPAVSSAGRAGHGSEALPPPDARGSMTVEQAIAARRSVREFSSTPLDRADLSQLLWAAQGMAPDGRHRNVPSAGALYPIELRAVCADGILRYHPSGHRLSLERAGDVRPQLAAAALGQAAVAKAPCTFVISAVVERTAVKYGQRALRYGLLEAGHVAQNLLLQAAARSLVGVPIGGFDDAEVAQALGLPRGDEPLYLVPVGHPAR